MASGNGLFQPVPNSGKVGSTIIVVFPYCISEPCWYILVVLIGLTCRHYIALYIEHIPLTTERKALKVLEVCERHQLKEQGELVSNGGGW